MHVDGKRFETEGNVKKSATSWQTDCTKMSSLLGEEALVSRWNKLISVNSGCLKV
jgi:hypothetical protein